MAETKKKKDGEEEDTSPARHLGPLLAPGSARDAAVARASMTPGGVGEALAPQSSSDYDRILAEERAKMLAEQSRSDAELGIAPAATTQTRPQTPDRRTVADALGTAVGQSAANNSRRALERNQDAAVVAVATASGSAQNETTPQKPPPAPAETVGDKKTTTPPPVETEKKEEPGYYDRVKAVRTKGGQIIFVDPATASQYAGQGADWISYKDAMEGAGAKTPPASGSSVIKGSTGAAFFQPNAAGYQGPDTRPFSEKLETMPREQIDLSRPASQTSTPSQFQGVFAHNISSTFTPSGVEAAADRQAYVDQRVEQERAKELSDQEAALRKAEMEYKLRFAQTDPLEAARINAMGRYGGEMVKTDFETQARLAALRVYQSFLPYINELEARVSTAKTVAERQAAQAQLDRLLRRAEIEAGLMLGRTWVDPNQNPFAALIAGAMGTASAASSNTEPKG